MIQRQRLFLVISILCLNPIMVYAQSSANYRIEINVLSAGGGLAGSSHYELDSAIGQSSAVGRSSSPGYANKAGFWHVIPEVMPFDSIYVDWIGTCGDKEPCFAVFQNGIDWAQTLTTINITQGTYTENILLNSPKILILRGGWDSAFTSCLSGTVIHGSLTISDGKLIVENLILQ